MQETVLQCVKCGHSWVPTKGKEPKVCPKCKTYKWKSPATAFLEDIARERNGFYLGNPYRLEGVYAGAIPILRETDIEREYITFEEANLEIRDTGSIGAVKVKNTTDKPVLIRGGTMFEGQGTQSRSATKSVVIMPSEEKEIEVKCIHASHGIRQGAEFVGKGIAPTPIRSELMKTALGNSTQHDVWKAISFYRAQTSTTTHYQYQSSTSGVPLGRAFFAHTSTAERLAESRNVYGLTSTAHVIDDNLIKKTEQAIKSIEDVMKQIPMHENQVGLAILGLDYCETIEVFDVHDSWKATHEDFLKKGVEEFFEEQAKKVFKFDKKAAKSLVKEVLTDSYKVERIWQSENAETYALKSEHYIGQLAVLNGKPIHLVLTRS